MRRGTRQGKKTETRSRVTAWGVRSPLIRTATDDDLRSCPELEGTDSGTIVGCSRPLPALQGSIEDTIHPYPRDKNDPSG